MLDYKWLCIGMIAVLVGVGVDRYNRNQCKIELAKSSRTASEIVEVCGN